MKTAMKIYFIPHKDNDYKPHLLHTKRTIFYTVLFVVVKIIVVAFAVSVPGQALVAADALKVERDRLLQLANEFRETNKVETLQINDKLEKSSYLKADDMALNQYFSHKSPQNNGLAYFLKQTGYQYKVAGENLAMGYNDADELFQAWLNSPSHYSNIVDTDYSQTGLGIVGGMYNDIPTLYIAQHFGQPKFEENLQKTVPAAPAVDTAKEPAIDDRPQVIPAQEMPKDQFNPEVDSVANDNGKEVLEANPNNLEKPNFNFDPDKSLLSWQEAQKGMSITAVVYVQGEIESVKVQIKNYEMNLWPKDNGSYVSTMYIKEKSDDFFKVVLPGTVIINGTDGQQLVEEIYWESIKPHQISVWEKYNLSKRRLAGITNVFQISKDIYAGFIMLFGTALILMIFIEIKHQHFQTIVQTFCLLGLLVVLYVV